jgi:hypothetical protein
MISVGSLHDTLDSVALKRPKRAGTAHSELSRSLIGRRNDFFGKGETEQFFAIEGDPRTAPLTMDIR